MAGFESMEQPQQQQPPVAASLSRVGVGGPNALALATAAANDEATTVFGGGRVRTSDSVRRSSIGSTSRRSYFAEEAAERSEVLFWNTSPAPSLQQQQQQQSLVSRTATATAASVRRVIGAGGGAEGRTGVPRATGTVLGARSRAETRLDASDGFRTTTRRSVSVSSAASATVGPGMHHRRCACT